MHNVAVLRLIDDDLVWYPPGAELEPRSLDSEAARQALRDAIAQQRLGVCFAAPGADVRLLRQVVSAQEKKHLAQALPYTLEEQLAEDVEQLHFATVALDREDYSVAVCTLAKMHEWAERLTDYPGIGQWVPEPLLLPWQSGEWCLLVEGDRAIARTGVAEGFGVECDLLPPMLAAAAGTPPGLIVIYGADEAADTALLPEALQARVQWRRGNWSSALLLQQALPPLNLLQGSFASRLPLARWWRDWRLVAAALAAAFALQLLATYASYHGLQKDNLSLRTAVEASYRQANPRGAMVEAEKQLNEQLRQLRGAGEGSGFVSLMERVGEVLAGQPGTALASINYNDRNGEIRMNIIARDFAAVERIRAGINAAGLVAEMENSSAQGDRVRARMRVGES